MFGLDAMLLPVIEPRLLGRPAHILVAVPGELLRRRVVARIILCEDVGWNDIVWILLECDAVWFGRWYSFS
jgi:hypothetical protein